MSKTGVSANATWPIAIELAVSDMNAGLTTATSPVRFAVVVTDSQSDPASYIPTVRKC